MDAILGLLGTIPGGGDGGGSGGGVPSGGSTTAGSILTKEVNNNNNQDMGLSAEVSSSYPIDDLELGLGLSIGGGGGGGGGLKSKGEACDWGQYARILTAKDFNSLTSKANSCSSSSSSSVKIPNPITSGTKRTAADSVSPPNSTSVVGWPPIRKAHRLPTLASHIKSPNEEFSLVAENNKNNNHCEEKKGFKCVKVNMDGTPIGRKVNLNAHSSYEMLARTLEDMFCARWSSAEAAGPLNLLNETSEFVLTYEDRDGDCMLVGDVPWQMFLSSVKRLRILRNPESRKLENAVLGFQEKNMQRRTDAV